MIQQNKIKLNLGQTWLGKQNIDNKNLHQLNEDDKWFIRQRYVEIIEINKEVSIDLTKKKL